MFKRKFYFDELYQAVIDRGVLGFSYVVSWFDRYVVNDTGVDGSAQITEFSGGILKYLQTGRCPYAMAWPSLVPRSPPAVRASPHES
jgi:NADH:ubiquinone oxidoreductase subunit 5 (subunit L)/multisubunit Na+/H+ antiporter MnhA subunit